MGGPLSADQRGRIWTHLDIVIKAHIATTFSYAEFAGIASFVERIFAAEFKVLAFLIQISSRFMFRGVYFFSGQDEA